MPRLSIFQSGSRWKRNGRVGDQRGAIALLMLFGLVIMLGLVALAVDVGYLLVVRTELQRTADAAALSAVQELVDVDTFANASNSAAVFDRACASAQQYALLNPGGGRALQIAAGTYDAPTDDFILGRVDPATGIFDRTASTYNAVAVRVRRDAVANGRVSLFFAGFLGIAESNSFAESAAVRVTDVRGFRSPYQSHRSTLIPFGLQIDAWKESRISGKDEYDHDRPNQSVAPMSDGIREMSLFPQGVGAGNFGTIDIGSASNGTAELRRQILDGPTEEDFSYFPNGRFELGADGTTTVEGDTGMSAAIKEDLLSIIGKPRTVPLYTTATGTGNTAEFTVVGFAGITVVGVQMTGPLRNRYIKIQPAVVVDQTVISGGEDGVTSEFIRGPAVLVRFPGS